MRKILWLVSLLPSLALAGSFSQVGFGPVTITTTALQAATNGHAYWVNGNTGALLDAGTSIAAANPTNQPPVVYDLSSLTNAQWSVFYGAETGAVGCKFALAELWPSQPVPVVGTVPPYLRDAGSHWLVAAGMLAGSPVTRGPIVQRVPADIDQIFSGVSALATAQDTLPINAEDYEFIYADMTTSAGTSSLYAYEVPDDIANSGQYRGEGVTPAAASGQKFAWGPGASLATGASANDYVVPYPVPPRVRVVASSAGAGNTTYLRIFGERKKPLRRIAKVAPYIQCTTFPSAASPIYLELWGGT
jgi:hypothetical protein